MLALIALIALGMLTGCCIEQGGTELCLGPADAGEGDYHQCWTTQAGEVCCTVRVKGPDYAHGFCSGEGVEAQFGCPMVTIVWDCREGPCGQSIWCAEETGGSIWLADVCEPDDGFSADGWMTWDSDYTGPLQVGASMEGPWHEVQVNGPPWAVSEVNLESFAELAGVEDWHDLWVRSGEGYPQHVGNAVLERDGRMDVLCAE
jgi:hypothetical protein